MQRELDGEDARLPVFVAIQQLVKHWGVHGKDQTVRLEKKSELIASKFCLRDRL